MMKASPLLRNLSHSTTTTTWAFSCASYRNFSTNGDVSNKKNPIPVTLFPGNGVGPALTHSVKEVLSKAQVPIEWEEYFVGDKVGHRIQSFLMRESLDSVRRNGVGIKAPMGKPLGKNIRSLYIAIREDLRLHSNVKIFNSLYGYKPRKNDVDLVTISEQVVRGVHESQTSMQLAEYAFDYAKIHGRGKVSAIHEPQVTTRSDALFLKCCREVANKYPEIKYEELTMEDCGIQLVKNHALLDVLVIHRFLNPIICDHCADLVGGLSFIPSCNIGEGNIALAEAVPGTTPDIDDKVLSTAEVPITWTERFVGQKDDPRTKSYFPWNILDSIWLNRVGLKAPMWKPIGNAHKLLSLYFNVKHFNSLYGYNPRKNNVDIVTVTLQMREADQSLVCIHVAEYAFYYAKTHGRDKVSAIHEPEITTKTSGHFLKCCREIANMYPEIRYEEFSREDCIMKLATDPAYFDVLAVDRFSDYYICSYCAALVGGLRFVPSCHFGEGGIALVEAVPSNEPYYTEKNLRNPIPLLLSTVMMLRHLKLHDKADQIHNAIVKTIAQGTHQTVDVDQVYATTCVTKAICNNL